MHWCTVLCCGTVVTLTGLGHSGGECTDAESETCELPGSKTRVGTTSVMIRRTILIWILFSAFAFNAPGVVAAEKRYVSWQTYKVLMALCPEVYGARLEGLLPAAEDLWSKGQLKMPEETHIVRGDFNRDGKAECALVIAGGGKQFLLIAEPEKSGTWKRKGLITIKSSIQEWNGRAFTLKQNGYVVWTGQRYEHQEGALAKYCYEYEPSAFTGVTIKMTYVGPQTEPYPGLLISSFYRMPNIAEFKSHRKQHVHYGNDDIPVMWHVAVAPATVQKLLQKLRNSAFIAQAEDRTGTEKEISHSFSILDTASAMRPNFYEVFLRGKESVELLKDLEQTLTVENQQAAKVAQEYARMFQQD